MPEANLPHNTSEDEDAMMHLEACLDAFLSIAPVEHLDQLLGLIPSDATIHREFLLVELVKLDMASAIEVGKLRRIESYCEALHPHLPIENVPFDLVLEEFQLRRESGLDPDPNGYARRFPKYKSLIPHVSQSIEATESAGSKRPPSELSAGNRIDDFLIIQTLGKGAFAHVYLARQLSMMRLVALKVSRGSGDESQALAQLDHPNIVRVYDQRTVADPSAKSKSTACVHLLYMQFLPGGTLSDVVRQVRETPLSELDGRLIVDIVDRNLLNTAQQVPDRSAVRRWLKTADWPVVVAWMGIQLAKALDEAHQRGVLHRDVKPANVLLSAEGVPKLADFNVSQSGAAGRAGAASSFGGSIGYMSPEHLEAIRPTAFTETPDVAQPADLFSLGVLLWELWQGKRPYDVGSTSKSWTDTVAAQLQSRHQPIPLVGDTTDGSQRVLERTILQCLAPDCNQRPTSGAELAGRLRLALHPNAARLFDPPEGSLPSRVLRLSPWLLAAAVILLPNILAGVFNFFYNQTNIIEMHPQMQAGFDWLALRVNAVAFPLGGFLMVYFSLPMARSLKAARLGTPVDLSSTDTMLKLCRRAALIGGTLWCVAGVVYTAVLTSWYPPDVFPRVEALHFFVSVLICGGVAGVYPYFGMLVLVTRVYYPALLRGSMQDPAFDQHADEVRIGSGSYLMAAAIIPLLAITLLVARKDPNIGIVNVAVLATGLGLILSFQAYKFAITTWEQMSDVLSTQRVSIVPGAGPDE
ncbi:MAG: serine/threonine-protein kinase [Planctomycetota bacterium]